MTTYSDGRASIANGASVVALTGGLAVPSTIKVGDQVVLNGDGTRLNAVKALAPGGDQTRFELVLPWTGAALNNAPYIVHHMPGGWGDTIELAEGVAENVRLIGQGLLTKVNYQTQAELFADLAWPDRALGKVWGDPVSANRGVYRKTGAIGTGAWTRIGDLPAADTSASPLTDGDKGGIVVSNGGAVFAIKDGDKGDITVSGSGATWRVNEGRLPEPRIAIERRTSPTGGSFVRGDTGWARFAHTFDAASIVTQDPTGDGLISRYFSRTRMQLSSNAASRLLYCGPSNFQSIDETKAYKLMAAVVATGPTNPLPCSFEVRCYDVGYNLISTIFIASSVPAGDTDGITNYRMAWVNPTGGSGANWPAGTVAAVVQFGFSSTAANQNLSVYGLAMIADDEYPGGISTAISNYGSGTHEAVSDGTFLYVVNHSLNEIAKFDGDLKKVAVLPCGDYPHDAVVVGTDLWIANQDAANVQRIPLSSFSIGNSYAITGGRFGFGLATDGTRLWLGAGTTAQGPGIYLVNRTNGAMTLVSSALDGGQANIPVRFFDNSLWTVMQGNSEVRRINPTGGATQATIQCSIGRIYGLGSGGGFVWANGTKGVVQIDPATNAIVQRYPFRQGIGHSNIEVVNGRAYACTSVGVLVINIAKRRSEEIMLEAGINKWARALPNGKVVVGSYGAPWMFVLSDK